VNSIQHILGIQKQDPTVMKAAQQIHQGVGVLYGAAKANVWKIVEFSGLNRAFELEKSISQVSEAMRSYSDTIFLALNVYCLWQNWIIFLAGTVTGMAISDKGLFEDSLQMLQSKQAVAEYNFVAMVLWFLVSQPVHSFTQGFFFGNRLGCPQIPNMPKQESFIASLLHKAAEQLA